ncbi:hypothetical protein [Mycobacterium sp. 852002-51971_SCH5477799-a]|uniref:hypothetical protein n=1 Tax=Mycobacterium sp. 852002-51971_SCH5477799-a TaxID=1834106 RepID=UPI001E4E0174|nr:hypothetical protein [Mycobacterium sp. 852002-51971_SCH5477799-a]
MDDGLGMLSPDTKACPLSVLAENDPEPPLYPYIGSAHWHVPWGQEYFDQGLRFYFAFNNRESYRAFRKAASEARDEGISCSACYWAQALVLGVDLNMKNENEKDRLEAIKSLDKAEDSYPNPEDEEIIRALRGRYLDCNPDKTDSDQEKICQGERNQAYYKGMKTVLHDFGRDDPNVVTLFADAAMNLTPWDFWDRNGDPKYPRFAEPITEAKKELERALNFVQYPRNEGPLHWYIHLMEQSPTPGDAERSADLLASLAPNAGHLVHMPSHIYFRMGDMRKAVDANKQAVEADERYFAEEPDLYRPDGDRYRYSYYPHNIHFVIDAAALSGDGDDVNDYAERLFESAPDNANPLRADLYRAVYYLARTNFSSSDDIRNFRKPDALNQQPLANIAYDFAHVMADIWGGRPYAESVGQFGKDLTKYRALAKGPNPTCDVKKRLPPVKLCLAAVLDNLQRARVEAANGKWNEAIDAAQSAIDIQKAMSDRSYDEPPVWPYPASQTLASILIRKADAEGPKTGPGQDDLDTAKRLLSTSLNLNRTPGVNPDRVPTDAFLGNGWAYYGLWEIAKWDDSPQAQADKALDALNNHWFGATQFRKLDRM